ncbi:hypothetical protein EZV62_015566 [Acer yangbiense]|uniref:CCHC-type domain-containing protein n=1 Tax=Acer yangbiense TaxID=1000413 RepID=A0A5C7HL37_9ROSI|nr:hypothetical protein EZV62_015566 [Acer yangbiense]
MSEAEISTLYENLTIVDEDASVLVMEEETKLDGEKDVDRCKSEEVTKINLKYERLPEFCFACGKIGHNDKECQDEEATKIGLDGSPYKFGSWLKAPISDRVKPKFGSQSLVSSAERSRSLEALRETEWDGSVNLKAASMASQKVSTVSRDAAAQCSSKMKQNETLVPVLDVRPTHESEMCIDGLGPYAEGTSKDMGLNATKKWKCSAREAKLKHAVGLTSSPFKRMLELSQSPRRSLKGHSSSSPKVIKKDVSIKKGRSPQKLTPAFITFPNKQCDVSTYRTVLDGQICKRKVDFECPDENSRS